MAMIDAYRIGVELVLGGDLAAGIEALIPALERLDTRVTQANAEAGELAAGLRDVAETAPGIGQAADQLSRLSAAMAGVNQATEALRSHGGLPEVGTPAQTEDGAGVSRPRPGGPRKDLPDVVAHLGLDDGNDGPSMPDQRPPSGLGSPSGEADVTRGLDGVMPALAAGGLVTSHFADRKAQELVSPVGGSAPLLRVSMPGADPAEDNPGVYASTARVLPAYVRNALIARDFGRVGPGASAEPVRGDDLESAIEPRRRRLGTGRVEEVEAVMSSLSRPGRFKTEVVAEPRPFVQELLPLIHDARPPEIGGLGIDVSRRERVLDEPQLRVEAHTSSGRGLSAIGKAMPGSEREVHSGARATGYAPVASISDAVQGFGPAGLDAAPKWLSTTPPWFGETLGGVETALKGLSSDVMALGASSVKEGSVGLTAHKGRGALLGLANSIVALNGAMGKAPEGWLSAARGVAPVEAGAPGAGFPASLTAPYREQGGGVSVTPHLHGYHPQGDQPGPVIHHITILHLDDREIARAVTRQQIRMMGGNVSGTLRPDPSIAPQYGAHLLET